MKYLKIYEELSNEIEVKFASTRSNIKFSIFKDRMGKILRISNDSVRFPYKVGERMNRNIETWACNNNFTIDGKNMCPEEKILGIKKSHIPKGHDLRRLYPSKFNEAFTEKDEHYRKLSQDEYGGFMYHSDSEVTKLPFTDVELKRIMKLFPEERLHQYHQFDKGRTLYQIYNGHLPGEYEMYIMAPYFQKGDKLCRIRLVKKKDNWYYVNKQINRVDNINRPEWKYTWYECDNIDGLVMLLKDIKRGKEEKFK